ncbi:NAD(P)H-dependent oxidoreductase [Bacteroides sp. UBA939]|uniref:NAD(P)H-dependent oxidoreductase n=1 Tax=Bacteroides sp. UBA939 TaxID=1946092 RepID=UPI0025C18B9A|nr:NAD(P)H-dependent oxidoreductase [Bacteroides sp. UBA939]
MDRDLKKVVVLLAHPNMKDSRANKELLNAIRDMGEVAVFNLYEMQSEDVFNIEVWNRVVSHAKAVVLQFPFHWMSAPSLLKKWQDEIFIQLAKTPAVAGKPLLVATTTGSDFDSYRSGGRNCFTVDELLRPYQVSAIHSGMLWQTPFVVYGIGSSKTEKNIAEGVDLYKKRIAAFIGEDQTEDSW